MRLLATTYLQLDNEGVGRGGGAYIVTPGELFTVEDAELAETLIEDGEAVLIAEPVSLARRAA